MKRRACSDDIIQRMSYLFPSKDTVKQRICVGDMTELPSGGVSRQPRWVDAMVIGVFGELGSQGYSIDAQRRGCVWAGRA